MNNIEYRMHLQLFALNYYYLAKVQSKMSYQGGGGNNAGSYGSGMIRPQPPMEYICAGR